MTKIGVVAFVLAPAVSNASAQGVVQLRFGRPQFPGVRPGTRRDNPRSACGCRFPDAENQRYSRVASMIASEFRPWTNVILDSPSISRSLSAATSFIGPGDGAFPGFGCGNAVDIAV